MDDHGPRFHRKLSILSRLLVGGMNPVTVEEQGSRPSGRVWAGGWNVTMAGQSWGAWGMRDRLDG
jgi:hypothetical protein